nr:hypothetical protein [Ectothiorhodospira haloalkaliphila]
MLFAHGAQAMLIFDPWADRILDANGASATLLGRSLESLPGLRMSTLHPRHFPRLLTFTQEVLECGKAGLTNWRCARRTGHADPSSTTPPASR